MKTDPFARLRVLLDGMTDHLPVSLIEAHKTLTDTVILHDAQSMAVADLYSGETTPFDEYLVAAMNAAPALLDRIAALEEELAIERHRADKYQARSVNGMRSYE